MIQIVCQKRNLCKKKKIGWTEQMLVKDYKTKNKVQFPILCWRYQAYLKDTVGVHQNDVIHMLTDGNDLDSVTALVAVLAVGAVPAISDAMLADTAVIDQVTLPTLIRIAYLQKLKCWLGA